MCDHHVPDRSEKKYVRIAQFCDGKSDFFAHRGAGAPPHPTPTPPGKKTLKDKVPGGSPRGNRKRALR